MGRQKASGGQRNRDGWSKDIGGADQDLQNQKHLQTMRRLAENRSAASSRSATLPSAESLRRGEESLPERTWPMKLISPERGHSSRVDDDDLSDRMSNRSHTAARSLFSDSLFQAKAQRGHVIALVIAYEPLQHR